MISLRNTIVRQINAKFKVDVDIPDKAPKFVYAIPSPIAYNFLIGTISSEKGFALETIFKELSLEK